MFLILAITSLFQKPIELLSLNGSSGSSGFIILPVKMQFIVLVTLYYVTTFLKKHQKSKNIYPQPFRPWPAAVSACKVHAQWKKKKEDSNEASQFLHSKTWPILINIMTYFEGLIGEIEAMLTTIKK